MPQKHEIYGFFYSFSKVFAENFIKKYSTGNEEWIEFETATITSGYVLHKLKILLFFFNSKRYRDFS